MLHPVLESLFLLKVARGYVAESIMSSEIDEKQELVNYIQNEASDYEVMHLVTMGEMPEEKYNTYSETEVWDFFKKGVVLEFSSLLEDVFAEDLMTLIFETGPVSDLGYSSAAPILEFHKAQGILSNAYLMEGNVGNKQRAINAGKSAKKDSWRTAAGNRTAQQDAAGLEKMRQHQKNKDSVTVKDRVKMAGNQISKYADENPVKTAGASAVAGVAGVAALFGLYKWYKAAKAKRAAAKTPEAKKAADAQVAKIKAKIKAKKAKA